MYYVAGSDEIWELKVINLSIVCWSVNWFMKSASKVVDGCFFAVYEKQPSELPL